MYLAILGEGGWLIKCLKLDCSANQTSIAAVPHLDLFHQFSQLLSLRGIEDTERRLSFEPV